MTIRLIEFDTVDEALEYERKKKQPTRDDNPIVILQPVAPAQSIAVSPADEGMPELVAPKRSRRHFLKNEREQTLVEVRVLRSQGKSIREIAQKLGFGETTIYHLMQTAGISTARIDIHRSVREKVVIVQQPSHKKQMWGKEYQPEEIERVRQEFMRYGYLDADRLRKLAREMQIKFNRAYMIFYTFRKRWRAEPQPERHALVTEKEIGDMKEYMGSAQRTATGRMPRSAFVRYAHEKGITKGRAQYIAECISTIVPERDMLTERKRWINARAKQMQKSDPRMNVNILFSRAQEEWNDHRKNLGTVSPEGTKMPQQKAKVTDDDLVFPAIYPLADESVRIFEQMFIDLIARKHSKIDYYIASGTLQLQAGHEWDYTTWIEFCKQVFASGKAIARALVGCDSAKIRLEKEGRSLVIKYG